jgi:hypothetical protein
MVKHPNSMKDELAHRAVAQSHQASYGKMLQQLLTDTF